MKSLLKLAVLLLLVSPVFATDIYFGPTSAGSNNGSSCANAYAYDDGAHGLGVSGTWTPGNNLHLCPGTFPGSAGGSNFIVAQNSGTSGSPITLIADQGAVTITATYWSGPVINLAGLSYITVNGDNNLTIRATDNGTALANQADNGICVNNGTPSASSSNVTVENLTCSNLYVHTCGSPISTCTDEGGQDTYGIDLWNVSNLVIQGNTLHDLNSGIRNSYATGSSFSTLTITGNTIYNINHGWFITDSSSSGTATLSPIYFYANNIHDWQNWDDYNGGGNPQNHHDGLIINTNSATSVLSNFYIYNNWLHGNIGSGMSAMVFSFPAVPAGISGIWFYHNIFENDATNYCTADGIVDPIDSGVRFIGNTVISNHTSCTQYSGQQESGLTIEDGATLTANEDNIYQNTTGYALQFSPSPGTITLSDYSDYYENTSWIYSGTSCSSLSCWQSLISGDSHSSTASPNLNASSSPPYQLNSASGAAYRTGANLYSLFGCSSPTIPGLGAGCSDYNGNALPSSGNWDMGAFYYSAGTSYTLTTTLVGTGSVSSSPSGISCPSTCSASYSASTVVTLTASAGTGYTFTGWTGSGCSGTGTCAVTMSAAESVTATFTQNAFPATQPFVIMGLLQNANGIYSLAEGSKSPSSSFPITVHLNCQPGAKGKTVATGFDVVCVLQ
jgi:uncharacterized repeat protein (TIGR02543 family)